MTTNYYTIRAEHKPGQLDTIEYEVEAQNPEQAIDWFIENEHIDDVLDEWDIAVIYEKKGINIAE